jgi:hypothetical protein
LTCIDGASAAAGGTAIYVPQAERIEGGSEEEYFKARGRICPLTIASPLRAVETAVDAQTCATYRKGPLVSRRLAIFSKPDVYEWRDIQFRYEYAFQPDLPNDAFGLAPGTPETDRLFQIEIATGQPRPPAELRYGQSPLDNTHFSLLVSGRVYLKGLRRLIGIYAGIPVADLWEGSENGVWIDKFVPFEHTGVFFHGYERIAVPGATDKDTEISLQESENAAITGFLRCDLEGTFPNPGCTLHENSPSFTLQFRFRRNQMHLIEKIRNHARAFTACLTWQDKEK